VDNNLILMNYTKDRFLRWNLVLITAFLHHLNIYLFYYQN